MAAAARPLPTPPFEPYEFEQYSNEDLGIAGFQLPANASSVVSGGGRWARINRSIPGITLRPAISQDTWATHDDEDDATAAYGDLEQFLHDEFPVLRELNPTGNELNCNQAIVAVDHMLNGVTTVRVPPTGRGLYGLFRLKEKYQGVKVDVTSYDDIIAAVRRVPDSRGAVYLRRGHFAHAINVVDTPAGVVFLDGQSETLAELWPDVEYIALMLYHPRYPLAADDDHQHEGGQDA